MIDRPKEVVLGCASAQEIFPGRKARPLPIVSIAWRHQPALPEVALAESLSTKRQVRRIIVGRTMATPEIHHLYRYDRQ